MFRQFHADAKTKELAALKEVDERVERDSANRQTKHLPHNKMQKVINVIVGIVL